jgi:hypothetical protein
MGSDFDVSWWFLVLWYVSICAYRGREDMCVHPFGPGIAQFGFIVIDILLLIFLLPSDDAKSAKERDALPVCLVSVDIAKLVVYYLMCRYATRKPHSESVVNSGHPSAAELI